MDALRIDKWLWAARFFKTRALAQDAIALGRVRIGGEKLKPAREARIGDLLVISRGEETFEVIVCGLSGQRGSATVAQALYDETPASVAERARRTELRRLAAEPASTLRGRPTKREARELRRWRDD